MLLKVVAVFLLPLPRSTSNIAKLRSTSKSTIIHGISKSSLPQLSPSNSNSVDANYKQQNNQNKAVNAS